YGGNLPTTPWTTNRDGRGPAWSNSLFEDNAEFGLGMRVALDQRLEGATIRLREMRDLIGPALADAILYADQVNEGELRDQRGRVSELKHRLDELLASDSDEGLAVNRSKLQSLRSVADVFVKKSVWLVGGDGWAYDIGYGGLDHVLASGRNV